MNCNALYFRIFLAFAVLCQLLGNVAGECHMEEIQNCQNAKEINSLIGVVLIPVNQLTEKCRELRIALDCALKPEYLKECEESKLANYKGNSNVLTALCQRYRYAYEQSGSCFSTSGLSIEIPMCLEDVDLAFDRCSGYAEVPDCVHDIITQQQKSCTQEDANLMRMLVAEYVKPIAKSEGCTWHDIDVSGIATTTVQTTTITTSTAVSSQPTKEEEKSENGNNQSGDVSTAPTYTGNDTTDSENVGRARQNENRSSNLAMSLSCVIFSLICIFNLMHFCCK